ncbi:hypothetical protein HRI_002958800 [Hibiscus trionum]|uniref:Centromere protein X n=1 Tax=Hibiscus trionum TaxID=183268 RepID=A0A9W7IAN0_HIBTR|nr:hypothetical protein HRI_002958800 [Hibiscus trionum]
MDRKKRKVKIEEQNQIHSAMDDHETPFLEPDLTRDIFKQIWTRKAQGFAISSFSVLTIFSFHFSLNSQLKTKDFGVLIPERGGTGFQNTDAMDHEIGAGASKKIRPTFANPNALKLSGELVRIFITETVQRAATVAEAEGGAKVEAIHLERILPQLLLDF